MRLIVFFDLPVTTVKQRKEYRLFRRRLMQEGFLMLQESVYSKMVINDAAAQGSIQRVRQFKPPEGLVQVLKITERQFATMEYIVGSAPMHEELDSSEGFVVL